MKKIILCLMVSILLVAGSVSSSPVANAGLNQTVLDREGDGYETVVLEGSSSSGAITAWEWTAGSTVISTNIRCLATFPVGINSVYLIVTDDQAQRDTNRVEITVTALSGPKQRRNLKDTPTADRFTRPMDLVWPANAGEADICLWKDDMFAAMSISIDDNCVPNHDWWVDLCNQYGWKITWFVVSSSVTNNPGFAGPWSAFQTLVDQGHDAQSHSIRHHSDDDVRPDAEVIVEYRDANAAIEANLTNMNVTTLAYPYGKGKRDISALYYIGVRGTHGSPNSPARIDYMDASATSSGINIDFLTAVLDGTSGISWMGSNVYLRGWVNAFTHFLNEDALTVMSSNAAYAASRANLWVETFEHVVQYGQERDTATLTILDNTTNQVSFTLSDEMDNAIFQMPLTVKVKMHPEWEGVRATQNGAPVESSVVSQGGALYALVQAVPDQGTVQISPAAPGAPTASFRLSPNSGLRPLPVFFSDTSTGTITNRVWNFGDGATTSTLATTVGHTYTSIGTYSVTLVVSGPTGVSTNIQTDAVSVTAPVPPTAAFSAAPVSGAIPLQVSFVDNSTGSITNRLWNFGDGTITNTDATSVPHTYITVGDYSVELIVSGLAGADTNTQSGLIRTARPVAPDGLVVYDPFDEASGSAVPSGWISNDPKNDHGYVKAGSLEVSGLAASVGNSFGLGHKTADYTLTFSGQNPAVGKTVYYSFMLRNNSPLDIMIGAVSYNLRLSSSTDIYGSGACVGWGGDYTQNKMGFSLSNRNRGYTQAVGTDNIKTAETYDIADVTYFIVVAYTRGATSVGGTVNLWVNPAESSFGVIPPVPTLSMPTYQNDEVFDILTIGSSGAAQYTARWQIDELRVGTEWASVAPAQVAAGSVDSDGDGIPDDWEITHFGIGVNPDAICSNGINTVREAYIAGLNPTSPSARFAVSNDWNVLGWNATSGRVYSVYWATNLLDGFQPLKTNILWPQNSWTDAANVAENSRFYKVDVQLAQ